MRPPRPPIPPPLDAFRPALSIRLADRVSGIGPATCPRSGGRAEATPRGRVGPARRREGGVFGPDAVRDTEDDQPFSSSAEALDLLGIPDIQRDLVEPRLSVDSQIDRIESTGWSGDTRRKVTLVLRNRTRRPEVLERYEETVR